MLPTSVPENRQCRIWEISRLIVLMEYVSGIRNSTINIYLEIFQNLLISCFKENHRVVLFKNGLFCPMVVLLLSVTLLSTSINFFTITNYYHTVQLPPRRQLLVQSQQWKHYSNIWNLFKVINKDTRTTSMTSPFGVFIVNFVPVFYLWLWISKCRLGSGQCLLSHNSYHLIVLKKRCHYFRGKRK